MDCLHSGQFLTEIKLPPHFLHDSPRIFYKGKTQKKKKADWGTGLVEFFFLHYPLLFH
jgi:hypothetical protein